MGFWRAQPPLIIRARIFSPLGYVHVALRSYHLQSSPSSLKIPLPFSTSRWPFYSDVEFKYVHVRSVHPRIMWANRGFPHPCGPNLILGSCNFSGNFSSKSQHQFSFCPFPFILRLPFLHAVWLPGRFLAQNVSSCSSLTRLFIRFGVDRLSISVSGCVSLTFKTFSC